MNVFKFGGASVKDVAGVKNLISVLTTVGHKNTLVVISAMGKTTNALEQIIEDYFKNKEQTPAGILPLKQYHIDIVKGLFKEQSAEVEEVIHKLFEELLSFFKSNKSPNYSFVYDQVVSYGELLSTTIIHYYLKFLFLNLQLNDLRLQLSLILRQHNLYQNQKLKFYQLANHLM